MWPTTVHVRLQAWSEWLSNAKAVLTMEPWFGTTQEGGAKPVNELAEGFIKGIGRDLKAFDKNVKGLKDPSKKMVPRAGRYDQTKTSSPSTENALGIVRVASGFEELYRRFTATPGNTLSLQARLAACLQASAGLRPRFHFSNRACNTGPVDTYRRSAGAVPCKKFAATIKYFVNAC